MKCTWKDCDKEAKYAQLDNDGVEWANLCGEHHFLLEEALDSLDPRILVARWIKAQGGAAKAAGRM